MPLFAKRCPCLRPQDNEVRILDYQHSSLEHVPTEVFMYERTLEELLVDANQIKDLPRELFCCHGLRKLSVGDNELRSLPHAIGSLVQLEELDISKNGIVSLPDNIKCCKHLRIVEASVNPLGKLPEGFMQLLNLTELYLNDTFLDYLPGSFGRLNKLKVLEVRENHLKTLPKSITRLSDLERLDIGINQFTELPDVVGSLTSLWELWCDQNQITHIPSTIGELKHLTFLDVSKNRLQELPSEIEGCLSLADLHLTQNLLRQLPESIGRLNNLTTLKIDDNRLESLPFSVGGLVSLSELNLSTNELQELPPSIGFLRHLRTLYADENYILEIPPELGSCSGITVLSLRSNNLTYLPDEIGRIPRLRVLNLSDNKLTVLPYSLTRLKELQALWLSENQSTPLVRLQSDLDRVSGQRILTCYLLPQQQKQGQEEEVCEDNNSFHPSLWEEERLRRQQIQFDFTDLPDSEGKLQRTPTPYPKEMKHRIQHMRNLALKQLNMPVPPTRPSPVKEQGRRAERARSGSGSVVEEQGPKPTSPLLGERHHLLRADKERAAKDKERIRHSKAVKSGDEEDDGGFLSGSMRKIRASNTDLSQSNTHLSHQGSVSQIPTADPRLMQPMQSGSLQGHYRGQIQRSRSGLPQWGHRPGTRGHGYESETGYRSDFEMFRKRRHDLRGSGYSSDMDKASQHSNHHHQRPRATRSEVGYNSDAEAHTRRQHAYYRPLQSGHRSMSSMGWQYGPPRPYTNAPISEKPTLACDEKYETDFSGKNAPQQPKVPPRPRNHESPRPASQTSLNTRTAAASQQNLRSSQYSALNCSQHSLASNHSHRPQVGMSHKSDPLNQSRQSIHREDRPPSVGSTSTASRPGRAGSVCSSRGANDSLDRRSLIITQGNPDSSTTSYHQRTPQQKKNNEDDAWKAQLQRACARMQKSPSTPTTPHHTESQGPHSQDVAIAAGSMFHPPPYKPTPPYTPPNKAGPAAASTPNLLPKMHHHSPSPLRTSHQHLVSPSPAGQGHRDPASSLPRSETSRSDDHTQDISQSKSDSQNTTVVRPDSLQIDDKSRDTPADTSHRGQRRLFTDDKSTNDEINSVPLAVGAAEAAAAAATLAAPQCWTSSAGMFDRDVAMYKQEPASQVSSSTDSGYVHGHPEKGQDFKPRCPDVPERENTAAKQEGAINKLTTPLELEPPNYVLSRESTPGKSPGDSGMGSDAESNHKKPHVFRVQLKKTSGLGLSIAGGLGSTGNPFRPDDLGIFITKVQPEGPAFNILRVGDKLLEVNEVDFSSIEHTAAVNTLRTTGQIVNMVVERM